MKRRNVLSVCVAVLFAVLGNACDRDPVDPTPTPSNPASTEGMYLGVIGFNDQLYIKDISYLNSSSYQSFTNFVDNLTPGNGTALFYADYTALKKMNAFPKPTQVEAMP